MLGSTTPEVILPASSEAEAGMMRPSGTEISWHRLIGPITATRFTRTELWVGAMGADRRPIASRFVSRLPINGVTPSIGHRFGRVWVGEALDVVGVYDTTTGERREYRSPAGRVNGHQAILGPDEIGVAVSYPSVAQGLETIELVRYDSLPVVPTPQ